MAINKETLDQLLSGRDPKEVFSKDGLFDELKKALAERVLNAEMRRRRRQGRRGEVVGCAQTPSAGWRPRGPIPRNSADALLFAYMEWTANHLISLISASRWIGGLALDQWTFCGHSQD